MANHAKSSNLFYKCKNGKLYAQVVEECSSKIVEYLKLLSPENYSSHL